MLPWARKGYASGRLRRCWGSAWTTSLAALTLATILGVPLAWLLARRDLFAKALVRALCVLPIIGIVVAAVQAGKPPPGSGARRYRGAGTADGCTERKVAHAGVRAPGGKAACGSPMRRPH